jgi:hypothetical protein
MPGNRKLVMLALGLSALILLGALTTLGANVGEHLAKRPTGGGPV